MRGSPQGGAAAAASSTAGRGSGSLAPSVAGIVVSLIIIPRVKDLLDGTDDIFNCIIRQTKLQFSSADVTHLIKIITISFESTMTQS